MDLPGEQFGRLVQGIAVAAAAVVVGTPTSSKRGQLDITHLVWDQWPPI